MKRTTSPELKHTHNHDHAHEKNHKENGQAPNAVNMPLLNKESGEKQVNIANDWIQNNKFYPLQVNLLQITEEESADHAQDDAKQTGVSDAEHSINQQVSRIILIKSPLIAGLSIVMHLLIMLLFRPTPFACTTTTTRRATQS